MSIFAVVMAGGGGTRFWPLSRKSHPKQLLNLTGKDVMVNETIKRLLPVVKTENIFIVTAATQAEGVSAVTKGLIPMENILVEPAARGTAACIGYAALKIQKRCGEGVMVVTPSDAYIKDEAEFARVVALAAKTAQEVNAPVTIGIKPTFPATGYGYLRAGAGEKTHRKNGVKKVLCFAEKPDFPTAKGYVESGEYLWNSGMFVWKTSVALDRIKRHLPNLYQGLQVIEKSVGTDEEKVVTDREYPLLESISIDYGVMEKSSDILTVEGDFGWNDVGSLDALGAIHNPDEKGNVTVGDVVTLESEDCVAYASTRTVTLLGVEGLIVVETPDAILACPKDRAQDVKKMVDELQKMGKKDLL